MSDGHGERETQEEDGRDELLHDPGNRGTQKVKGRGDEEEEREQNVWKQRKVR